MSQLSIFKLNRNPESEIKYSSKIPVNFKNKSPFLTRDQLFEKKWRLHNSQINDFISKNRLSSFKWTFDRILMEKIRVSNNIKMGTIQWFIPNNLWKPSKKKSLKKKSLKVSSQMFDLRGSFKKDPQTGKFLNLACVENGDTLYQQLRDKSYCQRELICYPYNLMKLSFVSQNLNLGGNYIHQLYNYCHDFTIEYLYLLTFLFESVIIYNTYWIVGLNFNPQKINLEKVIQKPFVITNKQQLDDLEKHLVSNFENKNKWYQLVLEEKFDEALTIDYHLYYNLILDLLKSAVKENTVSNYQREIGYLKYYFLTNFKKSFDNRRGKLVRINSGINKKESSFLQKLIKDHSLSVCLEIGMAFGVSTLAILIQLSHSRKKNKILISIDPFQRTQWESMGLQLISETGLEYMHKLVEEKSYIALPNLLKNNTGKFNFIFIDGWHTFDYTLVDFFYADKLLKIGGFIVIDDALHQGVNKCVQYIKRNLFKSYQVISSPNSMAAFKKVSEDTKNWDFHRNF